MTELHEVLSALCRDLCLRAWRTFWISAETQTGDTANVTTGEASEMLGGLLAPNTLRVMALRGMIKGALRPPGPKRQVKIPIDVVPSLLVDLGYTAPITPVRRPRSGHTTLDGELAS